MLKSQTDLAPLVSTLSRVAAARGLSDSAWAGAAGIPRESLSRLRRRTDCDFATLARLAAALDLRWQLVPGAPMPVTDDGLLPARFDRGDEERLLDLAASGNCDCEVWRTYGPGFFMGGLAVLLSASRLWTRADALALADQLHAGITEPATFREWLDRSPLRPARFLPQLEQRRAPVR